MSNLAINWARSVRGLDVPAKAVLLLLADHAGDTTSACNPSIKRLADDVGASERTIQRALVALRAAGLIHCDGKGGRGQTCHYTLRVPDRHNPTLFPHPLRDVSLAQKTSPAMSPIRGEDAAERVTPEAPFHEEQNAERVTPEAERVTPEVERVTPQAERVTRMAPEPNRTQRTHSTFNLDQPTPPMRDAFEIWWSDYPRKQAKADAKRAYVVARKRGATEAELLDALRRYDWPSERQFIPQAQKWLRGERWLDEPAAVGGGVGGGTNSARHRNKPETRPQRRTSFSVMAEHFRRTPDPAPEPENVIDGQSEAL
ncbi:helix-turn-helix domain-containing protein [Falsiroseomonas sp.]|uniref:helix-turn-helix domain-containing protein n=1 Tax=Falsiroseomonas sp. TaxID=2870721 RepID=UPI00271E6E85|nr:helix-turn-helix domain-containing protein [Falsiroseomonas sp.]MDO9502155.1 helix-turn-helix domain-containing protein [Falsiroseomonas sp.]